jgi:hypothetical protein
LQVADNDYAVGLVAETIAKSQYKDDTLIFVIEDDSQDGADHVDSHRSTAYVVGPYVKQHAVVSKAYNTVNLVRTMEDILGIGQLNLNDSVAVPMADVFDLHEKDWSFTAHPSEMLYSTQLPLPVQTVSNKKFALPTHDAAYWAAVTKGMDFSEEDKLDGKVYNQILWTGLKGGTYPEFKPGADLRKNRAEMLARYYGNHPKTPTVAATATQAVGSGQE